MNHVFAITWQLQRINTINYNFYSTIINMYNVFDTYQNSIDNT